MSAAAVLRSAGDAACRAFRPTAAAGFRRRILDANKGQPFSPRDQTIITPRRHYSCGAVNTKEILNNQLAAADRISKKLDEATDAFDTHYTLLEYLLQQKMKYERLKRVLVRAPIFIGIAYCVKRFCGGSGDEEAKKMAGSH